MFDPPAYVPVVIIDDVESAEPLAAALREGGLGCVEVTLRTEASAAAARRIARRFPEMLLGIGTVMKPDQLALGRDVGANFLVSPGYTAELLEAAAAQSLPFVPGASSTHEIMCCARHGFELLKYFPAVELGYQVIPHWEPVFPTVRFMVTGGVEEDMTRRYLGIRNVASVGSNWVATRQAIRDRDWASIAERARRAARFSKQG